MANTGALNVGVIRARVTGQRRDVISAGQKFSLLNGFVNRIKPEFDAAEFRTVDVEIDLNL